MKEMNESCVELNIYVDCDKCGNHESSDSSCEASAETNKCNNETCVKINVFVDCGKKKHCYSF